MISMLRKDAINGVMDDLAHVVTGDMLADPLTKRSVKPDSLLKCINNGVIPNCDKQAMFRELMQGKHKAYGQGLHTLAQWVVHNLRDAWEVTSFLGFPLRKEILDVLT